MNKNHEAQITELLSKITLREKICQLNQTPNPRWDEDKIADKLP